ncbi:MAG: OsmC family peroxiredoxin [Chloroflexota bacterium]|jgi:osmotically inducible protein OsmC|nr:OsmC family peroxiredoxin [Chloroflexota bacterium]HZA46122.1 OsmC family peroxiredoxin [Rubrobacter sp.]
MAKAERRAEVTWQGNLMKGSGTFDLASSGTMTGAQVTFARRIGNPEGSTSPEELIAAAHASCYAMALSNTLGEQGNDPEELNISATCTLDTDSLKITTMVLDIRGNVPGVDEEGFRSAAEQAEQICPVSNALRGNVDIQLNTRLA